MRVFVDEVDQPETGTVEEPSPSPCRLVALTVEPVLAPARPHRPPEPAFLIPHRFAARFTAGRVFVTGAVTFIGSGLLARSSRPP